MRIAIGAKYIKGINGGSDQYIDALGNLWLLKQDPFCENHPEEGSAYFARTVRMDTRDAEYPIEGMAEWTITNHETENEDETCDWERCLIYID